MFLTAIVNTVKAAAHRAHSFFQSPNPDINDFAISPCRIAWQTEKIRYTLKERERFCAGARQGWGDIMRFFPLAFVFLIVFPAGRAFSQAPDFFNERLDIIAARFESLNIPDLEKIQLPQAQSDGSFIFIYVWFPKTHRPTTASFEANVGDYFDVLAAGRRVYAGWCYARKPETDVIKTETGEIGVMRIWALGYHGRAPKAKCSGGLPGAAGRLGQTQVYRDPHSGLLSMVRSGHPTRFPSVDERVQ
jgi:hypothetical protein